MHFILVDILSRSSDIHVLPNRTLGPTNNLKMCIQKSKSTGWAADISHKLSLRKHCFKISKVAADWHELIAPRPSIASANILSVSRVADIVNDVIQPAVVNHDLTLNY